MQQRFAIRSGLVVFILAALCTQTQQRPPCPSPVDCGENALGVREHHHDGPSTKFISRIENLAAVKKLMEKLLMQHNALADGNVSGAEEGPSSSETPSPLAPMSISIEVEENSTERPLTSLALKQEDSTTERPPIQIVPADVFHVDQLKMAAESGHSSEHSSTTKKSNDEELFSELTTVEPQHVNPNEVAPTQPPKSIIVDKSGVQLAAPTQAPVSSTQKKNTSSYPVNLPPPTSINRNKTQRTTTQRPQIIVHPQKLNTPNLTPFTENPEKIKLRPTTEPRISTLKPVHLDHDVKDDVQLETLNRPIIRRKPTTPSVGSATSNRQKKKPINITPQSVVVKKRPKPVGKPQGSPGIRNPIRNSSSPPREPEDYIISALASIGDGGDENTNVDDDGDDGDEDDEYEEENSNEIEGEEENEDKDEDEDEDEYLSNSEEEIEERENLESVDGSGVISSVMKEVGALL